MDWLDKRIITRLMGNCRESYRNIARTYNVSCPTIIARTDRLRQYGVIQRFSAELSHKMLGVEWVLVDLQTSDEVGKTELLQQFEANECVGEVLMLEGGRCLVLAELHPSEKQQFLHCIRSIDAIERVEVSAIKQLDNGIVEGSCKYSSSGKKMMLEQHQFNILQCLVHNGRMSIREISSRTGLGPRQVRDVIRLFQACDSVHLTIKLNLTSTGRINFVLRYELNEHGTGPSDASSFMTEIYPEEHWFSFHNPSRNEMLHYMTVRSLRDIQTVIREISNLPYSENVTAHVVYSTMKSDGRTRSFLQSGNSDLAYRKIAGPGHFLQRFL